MNLILYSLILALQIILRIPRTGAVKENVHVSSDETAGIPTGANEIPRASKQPVAAPHASQDLRWRCKYAVVARRLDAAQRDVAE